MSGKYPRKQPFAVNKKTLLILVVILCLLIVSGIIIYVVLQNKDDNINVIDGIGVNKEQDAILLLLCDHLEWDSEKALKHSDHLFLLQSTYLLQL